MKGKASAPTRWDHYVSWVIKGKYFSFHDKKNIKESKWSKKLAKFKNRLNEWITLTYATALTKSNSRIVM